MTSNDFDHPEYLVETDWLERHLGDSNLRVFDCTINTHPNPDPKAGIRFPFVFTSGRGDYEKQHIPGAGFADILCDLSDLSHELPLMKPSAQQLTKVLSRYGIGDRTRVVLYSTSSPIWATRVWWLLRAYGFDSAAILNGGWSKWNAEGRPVSDEPCLYAPATLSARSQQGVFVGKDEVLSAINDDRSCVMSALPPEIHSGTSPMAFGRKGHIAGSVNVPAGNLHNPNDGTYLPAAQLRERFSAVNADKADRIITYCGGGIASSSNAFAMSLLGYDKVAVYDASMFEWGNDDSLPIETG